MTLNFEKAISKEEHDLTSLPAWAQKLILELMQRVKDLEAKLAKNSSNSSKPPSSDGLGKKLKVDSSRDKSGKRPGGQPGRQGKNLSQVSNPDYIQKHSPAMCDRCQVTLERVSPCDVEKRQVFDFPDIRIIVTEHRVESKICPCCARKVKAKFPESVTGTVQYGERVKAFAAYFLHQHMIPFERVVQIFEDVFGVSLSPGTCAKMDERLYKHLEEFEITLKAHLIASKVLHFDETGVRCEKKLKWIHVACSEAATFFGLHRKRGREAIDEQGILPKFTGIAVHDNWKPYFAYVQLKHGLCNAHHLRELRFVYEEEKASWAQEMSQCLLKAKKVTDKAILHCLDGIPAEELLEIEKEYEKILLRAGLFYIDGSQTGPPSQKGPNLFHRFLNKMREILAFCYDLRVPFTNNLAERDLRMEKVKQKVSGCFRKDIGGMRSCRIRSYISTARKQGWSIIESLAQAISGKPRLDILHFI